MVLRPEETGTTTSGTHLELEVIDELGDDIESDGKESNGNDEYISHRDSSIEVDGFGDNNYDDGMINKEIEDETHYMAIPDHNNKASSSSGDPLISQTSDIPEHDIEPEPNAALQNDNNFPQTPKVSLKRK
ncbi:hypothetical protein BT96DRAFT_985845 [Gymnopus androsaceus JB14]|uniref:Uncharacterized protein n=1 Tax=Gymnopus androsaceus JB14 TaxID=1447944 RepID=A0A6A4IFL1_9AGAR|nr:hypothetical protein BT96DRAFT_985845 [Gymnopus androsaceus JB14]